MDIAADLQRVSELVQLTSGRVAPELSERAERVLTKVDRRLQLGQQAVVAIAGPTGAGKSSLVNALAGKHVADPGFRRPTTSQTLAVSFGPTNTQLLDWLEVTRRFEVPADTLADLVLLDLPDHDSVAVTHREEVDRLVPVVDQFLWVTGPQKYADQSIHQRYLRPLAGHADVITVVFNQADRLRPHELNQCVGHLKQLLADDGLPRVRVIATSAVSQDGIDELRQHLHKIARSKQAASQRLHADLTALASEFDQATAAPRTPAVSKAAVERLQRGMMHAAGVPIVVHAVEKAMVHRGTLATGWPMVSWWRRFRPDPLRRLRLGAPKEQPPAEIPSHTSLPSTMSSAAHVSLAVRGLLDDCAPGLPGTWLESVRGRLHDSVESLPDAMDRSIATADLATERVPVWWKLISFLQWLLIAAVVMGLGWLTINFALLYFGLPQLPRVTVGSSDVHVPLPTLLIGGGLILGFVLSVVSRFFVGFGAKATARHAQRVLRRRIAAVAEEHVVQPLKDELERYQQARSLISQLR